MRFELSVAFKYLIPRSKQLSLSIISLISIFVISLVVWLVIVFLSVTEGIEKRWIDELIALNAPLRLTPTEKYYQSYYYQIDSVSSTSDYTLKTVGEKLQTSQSDPYDPHIDRELGFDFPTPDKNPDGSLKDLAKETWDILSSFPETRLQEFEITFGNLRLNLQREEGGERSETFLTQVSYVATHDSHNTRFNELLLSPSRADLANLEGIAKDIEIPSLWAHAQGEEKTVVIPQNTPLGEGILLSKTFQDNGVLLGDQGFLSYYTPTASANQEQRIPVYVAGFYDPGLMPVGNRIIFVPPYVTSLLRGNLSVADRMLGNGIHVWLDNINTLPALKEKIQLQLDEKGLGDYWEVEAFTDYEFARPVLQQLQSDKTLFSLIAIIILIVACSNVVSMLILLVNDKKREIGILMSMGASARRIASIFGICGFTMGLISSILGTGAAIWTLHNLQSLVNFLSFLQGHEAFQAAFYGNKLPNEPSVSALVFAILATSAIALLAGIVPAIKAARLRPSEILRAE